MSKTSIISLAIFGIIFCSILMCGFVTSCVIYVNESRKPAECDACAYINSVDAVMLAGKYRRGDPAWDEKNEEWLNSNSDETYPEDLNDIDGSGYRDALDSATKIA